MRTRPKLLVPLFLAAASLALAGCVKQSDDVTVTADGSGTFSESIVLDLAAMKGLEDALGGPGNGKDAPGMGEGKSGPANDDPLEKLKKEWKGIEGLEVTKATSEQKDGKTVVAIEAKFKTLEAYARATGMEMNAELKKNDDDTWTLKFTSNAQQAGGGAGGKDEAAEMAKAMMPMLEPFMKDLEVTRKLTVPGTVVSTDGVKSEDGTSVTWKVTWEDLKKGGDMPAQTVTFKGEDLELKPFSIQRAHEGGPGGPGPK